MAPAHRRYARVHTRAVFIAIVITAFSVPSSKAGEAEKPPKNPTPAQVRQEGYNVTTERPAELLPRERGPAQDKLLNPLDIGLAVPATDALGALAGVPSALPPLNFVPKLELGKLSGALTTKLPAVDLERIQQPIGEVVDTVGEVVEYTQAVATAVAAGVHSAASSQESATEDQEDAGPADFRLTTTSGGVTQTFTMTLCTPTPINVTSTSPLTPTTLVSLCPVPLALASVVLVPPPGQPFQLYLSVQRLAGTAAVSARFAAEYDVPSTSTPLTVRFGIDSGGNPYPANGIVGAATDYNPFTNSAAEHLTMGWATDGPTAALAVEAVGVGLVQVAANPIPAESGSFSLSYTNGEFNSSLTRTAAPTPGSAPSVSITAPVPRASGSTVAHLVWSEVPQDYTFSLRPTLVDGRPTGVAFDGNQTRAPSAEFGVRLDYITDGQLSARMQQHRFGARFSESIQTSQDQNGNPTGVHIQASPDALSTLVLSTYKAGALAAVIELVDIPSAASEFTFQLEGTGPSAAVGGTIRATGAPAFIGALSYFTGLVGGTVSAAPQVSVKLETGAPLTVTPPVAIPSGVQVALAVARVNPTFEIKLQSTTATTGDETGVTGFMISGTSPAATADQLVIDYQADPWTRARALMNSLGQQWNFSANLHGTLRNPTGMDVSDTNVPSNPSEFKQLYLWQLVGGSYQPKYSFTVQRPGSVTTGALAAAPENITVTNPPSSFRLSADYTVTTDADVCEQVLALHGDSAEKATGSISLGAFDLSLTASRVFAQGNWHLWATATSKTTECSPDTFDFEMHQDIGGNPDGVLTATHAGRGRVTMRSFATTSTVTVHVHRQGNDVAGGTVQGRNSEPNAGQQIQLEQFQGTTTTVAMNLWAGATGALVHGTEGTIVVSNIPQVFGMSIDQTITSGNRSLNVHAYNAAPAPAETMTITAPAKDLSPGGTIRFVMRSFDTESEFGMEVPNELDLGDFRVQVRNANVNANLTQVIAADVRNASGTPVLAALMSRPSGNTAGLVSSATSGALVWTNIPEAFDVVLDAKLPPVDDGSYYGEMRLEVLHASATPSSTMLLTQPSQRVTLALEGLGVAQRLAIGFRRDLQARTASLDISGTVPDGFRNIQLMSEWNSVRDAVLTVYRSGPVRSNGTTRGTNVWIDPAFDQRAFEVHGSIDADEVTLRSGADVVGQRQSLSQYFYSPAPGQFGNCVWSDIRYPCTRVDMWEMPRSSNLTMVAPSPDCGAAPGMPELNYAATDSNLRLTVDSLIPCLGGSLAFYGLPAHGITMEGALGDFCNQGPQLTMKVTPGFGESMPFMYIDGYNIPLVSVCTKTMSLTGPPLPPTVTVRGTLTAQLNYRANITLQAQAGLTEIQVVPVPNQKGEFFGLEGIMAKGNPNARLTVGMTLGLGPLHSTAGTLLPNEVSWEWEATAFDFFLADSDWDTIRWYESDFNYGVGWMSSYVWEAFPGNTKRYTMNPFSCADTETETNHHTTLNWSPQIPFQPGFTKVNNGLVICGGRVAYYQLNPQNIAFRHCSEATFWACPGGLNTGASSEWSYADLQLAGYYSDWVLAAAMKALYNHDPAGFTEAVEKP